MSEDINLYTNKQYICMQYKFGLASILKFDGV